MYKSPSHLSQEARRHIADALNGCLVDGLDLHGQIKVAHWNIKGMHFASLHPLFETFAITLAEFNDTIAERSVTLGSQVYGTAKHVAKNSRITDYPQDVTLDVEHVKLLVERFEQYVEHLHKARTVIEKHNDIDSVDLLTNVITTFEKHAWFLRATLGA